MMVGLLALASCNHYQPTPSPTPVVSPTWVALAISSATPTLAPDTAVSSTPTVPPSVTPTPTWTPAPTPTPFPDVPLPSTTVDYQLRSPDPNKLITVLNMAAAYSSFWHLQERERLPANRREEALSRFVEFDSQHYYPDGVPGANELTVPPSLLWKLSSANIVWPILRAGVVQYLNERSIQLQHEATQEFPNLLLTAYKVKSPDDAKVERWLIYVRFMQYASSGTTAVGFIPLELDEAGHYYLIPNSLKLHASAPIYAPSETNVHIDYDLVGTAENDIVIQQYGHSGGSHNYWHIDIYIWNQSGMSLAKSIREYHDLSRGPDAPIYDIGDFTDDGRNDLRVTTRLNELFGCQYDRIDIYSWSGNQPQHSSVGPPDTAVCNVWQGLVGSKNDPSQAIYFLEKAVEQWTVETAPSADFLAFLYVRLAMTYASQGLDDEAMRVLENVYQLPDNASYVQLVQNHLEKIKTNDPVTFCYNLYLDREQAKDTEIRQYVYPRREGDPDVTYWICPIQELVISRLQTMFFPATNSPLDALATANLAFAFAHTVNIDADNDLEWLGILEPNRVPRLVILDAVNDQWQPIRIIDFHHEPLVDFQFQLRDVTGDTEPEIVTFTASDDSQGNRQYKVTVETLSEREYDFMDTEYAEWLGVPANLEEFDNDYFGLVKPAWYTLLEFDSIDQDLPGYLEDLETEVISQTQSLETESKLAALIAYLPREEPALRSSINELRYLLGLNYELMEAEERAIATYLDLIEQAPNSPWSWLAWARLD